MQRSNLWLASRLLNTSVYNGAGATLGEIEDLIIDPATGDVQYAILSPSGIPRFAERLLPIPWQSLTLASAGDNVLLSMDDVTLKSAPIFERDRWPDFTDPVWRRSVDQYYAAARPVLAQRRGLMKHRPSGLRVAGAILIIGLLVALGGIAYLISTRGWEEASQDVKSSFKSAAYAAKETTQDASLTTKVKTALSLSRRIPADTINVDSQNGVVTLRGEVPSQELRDLAESITRDVPGVSEVHNHLFAVAAPH